MPQYNYQLFHFDLATALSERIPLQGGFVYIKEASNSDAYINVRVNDNTADDIKLVRKTGIITPFKELFLNAPAQAGRTLDLLITSGYEEFRVLEQSLQDVSIVSDLTAWAGLQVINLSLVLANTEYAQVLTPFKALVIRARGGDVKMTSVVGQSGITYLTIQNGAMLVVDRAKMTSNLTLYFQSPTAGAVVEIVRLV